MASLSQTDVPSCCTHGVTESRIHKLDGFHYEPEDVSYPPKYRWRAVTWKFACAGTVTTTSCQPVDVTPVGE